MTHIAYPWCSRRERKCNGRRGATFYETFQQVAMERNVPRFRYNAFKHKFISFFRRIYHVKRPETSVISQYAYSKYNKWK